MIDVEDRPGSLGRLARALGDARVNIGVVPAIGASSAMFQGLVAMKPEGAKLVVAHRRHGGGAGGVARRAATRRAMSAKLRSVW